MKYFCILFNEDVSHIIKYYCNDHINKNINHLSSYNKFIYIYKIKKTKDFKLENISYDKIISILGNKKDYIELLEKLYNTKLNYLKKIKEYILPNNYINYQGIEILDIIVNYEFEKLGLDIKKFTQKEIDFINKKNNDSLLKKKEDNIKKYELLLIEITSKSIR